MTKASPEIEAKARERLDADERRITGASRRTSQTLRQAAKAFWSHPSPWLIGGFLAGSVAYRATLRSFVWPELIAPVVLVVLFPVIEWVIHVGILHWRPRRVAGVPVDSLLARKHREHHADPRVLPLVFVPWQAELWLLPSYVVVVLLALPGLDDGSLVPGGGRRTDVQLRVGPLPGAQRLPAAVTGLPRGVAQPSPAPLQERALLVHGDLGGHGRPPVRHLPGRVHGHAARRPCAICTRSRRAVRRARSPCGRWRTARSSRRTRWSAPCADWCRCTRPRRRRRIGCRARRRWRCSCRCSRG